MSASKPVSARKLGSDFKRVDAHIIQAEEYEDLPEITDEMLARAKVNKGGRPKLLNTRKLISLRLPDEVIARWRATGPGWQTRMAKRLIEAAEAFDSSPGYTALKANRDKAAKWRSYVVEGLPN